jgi:hypothetical protein
MRMRRRLYLITLVILQLALVFKLAPPLGEALRLDVAPGLAPRGWPAVLQLVATAAAIFGASLALAFPGFALARHRRGGALRFYGLPGWAIVLSFCGAIALAAGFVALALVPMLPVEARMTAILIARPVVAGGLALVTAGVLCAELLRRSIASVRASNERSRRTGRVEVTHPPDLRTQAA